MMSGLFIYLILTCIEPVELHSEIAGFIPPGKQPWSMYNMIVDFFYEELASKGPLFEVVEGVLDVSYLGPVEMDSSVKYIFYI